MSIDIVTGLSDEEAVRLAAAANAVNAAMQGMWVRHPCRDRV